MQPDETIHYDVRRLIIDSVFVWGYLVRVVRTLMRELSVSSFDELVVRLLLGLIVEEGGGGLVGSVSINEKIYFIEDALGFIDNVVIAWT